MLTATRPARFASPAAKLAHECAQISDISARRRAAIGVMRAAAHQGAYVTWNASVMATSAKSWIRSCGLAGDTFAPTLAREYSTQHRGRGTTKEIF